MGVQSYRELVAWQKAMDLVTEIYRCTTSFPANEIYGITRQMRRAAVSIPSNIAEGQGKVMTGEFKQSLGHARGSLLELETQIVISRRLNLLDDTASEKLLQITAEVGRVLNGLISSLNSETARARAQAARA
jgi:four helix bundle protein